MISFPFAAAAVAKSFIIFSSLRFTTTTRGGRRGRRVRDGKVSPSIIVRLAFLRARLRRRLVNLCMRTCDACQP